MMHHGQAKQPCRMGAHDRPVQKEEQETRADERGKESEDAEIPEQIGIEMREAGGAQEQSQCEQQAHCGHDAIGRNNERTEVEEDGIHLREE